MKINCQQVLKDLEGQPIPLDGKKLTVGLVLSKLIIQTKIDCFDNMKRYILGKKFYESKEIEVDSADIEKIKQVLEKDNANFTALINGQILEIIAK